MFAFLFTISFKSPCESHPLAKIEVMAFSPKEVKSTTTSCTPETGKVKKLCWNFRRVITLFYRLSKRGSRWRPSRREEQSRMLKRGWLWSEEEEKEKDFRELWERDCQLGTSWRCTRRGDRTATRPFYQGWKWKIALNCSFRRRVRQPQPWTPTQVMVEGLKRFYLVQINSAHVTKDMIGLDAIDHLELTDKGGKVSRSPN